MYYPRMPKTARASILQHEQLILRLYVEEQLSPSQISHRLRDMNVHFTPGVIGPFVKSLGVARTPSQAIKLRASHKDYKFEPRQCRFCGELFTRTASRQQACHDCMPDKTMRKLLFSYGINQRQYDAMLERQNNRCAICERSFSNMPRHRVMIDHDHKTGVVRGILCSRCNPLLAALDDTDWHTKATAYITCASSVPRGP